MLFVLKLDHKKGNIVFSGTPRGLTSLSDFHNAVVMVISRDEAESLKMKSKNLASRAM